MRGAGPSFGCGGFQSLALGTDLTEQTAKAKAEIGTAIARVIELPSSGLQDAALRYLWRARELMDEISNAQAFEESRDALG